MEGECHVMIRLRWARFITNMSYIKSQSNSYDFTFNTQLRNGKVWPYFWCMITGGVGSLTSDIQCAGSWLLLSVKTCKTVATSPDGHMDNWLTVSNHCDILNVLAVGHNKLRQPSTANDLSSAPQIIVTFEHRELLSLAKTDSEDD